MNESTMYDWPRSGPTLPICESAQPASPARPEPSPNAHVSTRDVGTPTQAAIARYLGKSRPAPDDSPLKKLRVSDRAALPKAVLLLRLARALNQSRRGAVQKITARIRDSNVWLRPVGKKDLMDLELWATEKEKGYFREVFGRELLLTSGDS